MKPTLAAILASILVAQSEGDPGFATAVTESLARIENGGTRWLFAFTHGRGAWKVRLG